MILSLGELEKLVIEGAMTLEDVAFHYGEEMADRLLTALLPDPLDESLGG